MEGQLVTVSENKPLTVVEIQSQINTIQQVLRNVMQNEVHYGVVPGCGDKPSLLKPGAEKIMATFRLSADPIVEDLSTDDCRRYRVACRIIASDGRLVGTGVGECSSDEEKYKWRKAVCDEEFDETMDDRKRNKWSSYYDKYTKKKTTSQIKQIRTNPADIANTVLKMAKKRALIDGVLTATAASDLFTQDIEDVPEDLRDKVTEKTPPVQQPQEKKPEQVAGEMAKDLEAGTAEESISVSKALLIDVGQTIVSIKGTIVKKVAPSTERSPWGYKLSDGTNTMIVSVFDDGSAPEHALVFAMNVVVKDYKGKKQYTAESLQAAE